MPTPPAPPTPPGPAPGPEPAHGPSALDDLLAGMPDAVVARAHRLPLAATHGIRSFYDHLRRAFPHAACTGTACHFAGAPADPPAVGMDAVHCLGRCYEGPATTAEVPGRIPRRSLTSPAGILRHLLGDDTDPWADYALPDGEAILGAVAAAGLRGRGGAAFPTAAKWRTARDTPAADRVVVANGDEGDPGAFVDRLLLEESPHAVLAGVVACARAIGATTAIVFVRGEYPRAHATMTRAIAEADARGLLGPLRARVVRGAGSYVAGEETALLRAIEGRRAEPSPKPPYPAVAGLWGLPTVVQNVETLAMVPWVVRNGRCTDTKGFSLSGAVRSPGVVEAPLGIPLAELLERGGDGPAAGRRWKMALVGGPLGRVIPIERFDVPLSYDTLPGLGHAGVHVLDDTVSAQALAAHLAAFARTESCGLCAPCRIGSERLGHVRDRGVLEGLLATLEAGSLCGFGQGVPRPLRDLLAAFPAERVP